MKRLTLILSMAILTVLAMQSCEKQQMAGPVDEVTPKIKSSSTKVYPYDGGDTLLFTGAAATDSLKWTITPETSTYIRQKGNVAVIVFGKAGSYTVKAQKVSGRTSATTTITVSSSIVVAGADTVTTRSDITNSQSDTLQLVPITNDVHIILGSSGKRIDGKVKINMAAGVYVSNYYCRNAMLQYKSSFTYENGFILDVINIRQSVGCPVFTQSTTATSPGLSTGWDNVFVQRSLSIGTYPLKVRVGTTIYTGSIVVSPTNITLNWPYTSGVVTLFNWVINI